MLERVLEVRKQTRLVEELGGLEFRERPLQLIATDVGDRLEERDRDVRADDRGGLQESFELGPEPVDAGGQHQRRDDARRQLAEVYGWFTEGFDTRDLREARQMLDTLGPAVT